ncbi:MAG TPA: TlyA family RNA methyltransferase [Anaerolineaceae bacterium]|nr:TlyA family RNA methyltransferase [Anaerolineaceae bacterium]
MHKERLDVLLTERGLAESRSQAQGLIMAGQVRVNGQVELKPATKVALDAPIDLDQGPRFVSRGGEKLEGAFEAFEWDVEGRVCADVGASTGGFTDCLLQHGAMKVYAIDVGYGILHWKMRTDPRVVSMERTNARFVEGLPEPVSRVTVDASFISLHILLPVIRAWLPEQGGEMVALIKPQFEAGREEVARGEGVIHDPEIHRKVLRTVLESALGDGYFVNGLIRSPLKGPKGNTEFLVWLTTEPQSDIDVQVRIDELMKEEE